MGTITTEIQKEQASILPLDVSKSTENTIDVKQKHAGVQIYSLNRDSDDSGISLKKSVTTSIAFTNKTIERSTAPLRLKKKHQHLLYFLSHGIIENLCDIKEEVVK